MSKHIEGATWRVVNRKTGVDAGVSFNTRAEARLWIVAMRAQTSIQLFWQPVQYRPTTPVDFIRGLLSTKHIWNAP